MFCHYLDAHRAMLAMIREHALLVSYGHRHGYIVVRVAMNHFEVQRG